MADDSQWNLIRERARMAGMNCSRFVIERALEPPNIDREDGLNEAVLRRAVVDLRILVLVEQLRFEQGGAGDQWERLVAEAEASLAADEAVG